jgi:N-acetyl-gamma-glutamyl-phosphate reductase
VKQLRAAIWAASGYAGGELIGILGRHSFVTLGRTFAQSSVGALVSDIHPRADQDGRTFEAYTSSESLDADICFLALPHGEAMEIAPTLLEAGKIVIDLSGDHRLKDTALFEQYYQRPQTSQQVLQHAVYGLPEWSCEAIRNARLIANPGCYATSAILALAPLLVDHLIDPTSIIVNSMSGVSGAGRKASVDYSFVEINETVKAYRVGDHQHIPEIETVLGDLSSQNVRITFIPHLIPITRAIYTTICANISSDTSFDRLAGSFEAHYVGKPFVRFHRERLPEIRRVTGTNFIDIGLRYLPERNQVIVISALDNLIKGAAGQAVQNMNIACGFPEMEGIIRA